MQLKFFIILILFLSIHTAYGQHTLRGQLVDSTGQQVSDATVTLNHSTSSSSWSAVSDDQGFFIFQIPNGSYQLKVTCLGFQDFFKSPIAITDQDLQLGKIQLKTDEQFIEAIHIKGERRLIEQKSDRMILNVANSILADGMNALEILQRAPGVKVDDDGKIQMRGKADVGVLINGKLSYLSSSELATLLKGPASSNIQRVELITNPSSKYDAQGMGGLINIVMKREMKSGFNGSVNVFGGGGRKERYGLAAQLNANVNRWNMMASFNKAYRGEEEYRNFNRYFEKRPQENLARMSNQYSLTSEPLETNSAKLAVDFLPTERTSIGVLWSTDFGTYKNFNQGYNNILYSDQQMISNTLTNNAILSQWNTHNFNVNFTQTFNEQGDELRADLDYMYADYDANQLLISDYQKTTFQNAYTSSRRNLTPSISKLYIGKIDYTKHISEGQVFEIGWKSSSIEADNNSINDTLKNQQWLHDVGNSNHFKYQEQIHAGYLNYQLEKGKWNLVMGLRAEHTNAVGNQLTTQQRFTRQYTNWFPSASLSHKFSDKNNLQLSYSRRINRPDYEDLNPFRFYVDAFVFFEGNPTLQPELANAFELNYSFGKNLNLSVFYTEVSDVMTNVLTQIPDRNTTIRSVANIAGFQNKGLSINHAYAVTKFWTSINNAVLFENYYFGEFNQERINQRQWSYSLQSNNTFKLGAGFSAELNAQYNSPETDGVFKRKSYGQVSAGLMKQVWKDKIALKLSATDLFRTMRYATSSESSGVRMQQNFNLDSRVLLLSATWKIGKELKSKRKEHQESDEQKRMRGGN